MIPYLALVLTTTYHELYFAHQSLAKDAKTDQITASESAHEDDNENAKQSQEELDSDFGFAAKNCIYIPDPRKDGFKIRLLLMEHFCGHKSTASEQSYSFTTFLQLVEAIERIGQGSLTILDAAN